MAEGLVNKVDGGAGQATMDVEDEGRKCAVGAVGRCLVFGDFVRIGILVGLVLVVLVDFNVGSGCGVDATVVEVCDTIGLSASIFLPSLSNPSGVRSAACLEEVDQVGQDAVVHCVASRLVVEVAV